MWCVQVILKASSLEVKMLWVRKMRQLIQDTYFGNSHVAASLPSLSVPSSRGSKSTMSQRSSRSAHLSFKCHCQSLNTLTQSFLFSFLFSLSPFLLGWNRDYRVEIVCKVSCPVIPSPPPSLPISSINFLLAQSFSFSLSLSCIPPPQKKVKDVLTASQRGGWGLEGIPVIFFSCHIFM